jgi:hypothetical protein
MGGGALIDRGVVPHTYMMLRDSPVAIYRGGASAAGAKPADAIGDQRVTIIATRT